MLEVEEVIVSKTHTTQDNLIGLCTECYVSHNGVVGLIRVSEEWNLLTRYDGIIEVDTCDTCSDKLRRLDTTEGVYCRTANLACLTLNLLTALKWLTICVEETTRQSVRYTQYGGLTVEYNLRVCCKTLSTCKHLKRNLVAHNLYHLCKTATYSSKLIITYACSTKRDGSLGDIINLCIYFLKCSCCHSFSYFASFSFTRFSILSLKPSNCSDFHSQ